MLFHRISVSARKGPGDSDLLPFGDPPAVPVISSPLNPNHLPVLNFLPPKISIPSPLLRLSREEFLMCSLWSSAKWFNMSAVAAGVGQ